MRKGTGKTVRTLIVVGTTLLAFNAAAAEDPQGALAETQGPEIESSIGVGTTNQYFFRGILQENQGLIVQPWIDFVFPLAGESTAWSFNMGIWNSLHDGPSGSGGAGTMHYELDAYAGIGVDFAKNWSGSITYIVLSSPNSAFSTVQELDFSISIDDSGLFGGFSGLQPSVLVAWELDGQSDGGGDEGIYLQVDLEPAFDLIGDVVSASLPVVGGFSLSNYYEDSMGNDDFFGYAQGGVSLSAPLSFVSPRVGTWILNGGVGILFLGDNLEAINGGESSEVILSLGMEIAF